MTDSRRWSASRSQAAAPGSILLLENTRRYDIERVLWKAKPDDLPKLAEPLAQLANQFAEKVATVYVNEALSAGSLDSSSTVVPAGMDRVALGEYVADEFDGPMMRCLATQLVVFSGLKIDKLDDLEAMIGRGTIRMVFTAGSLAMALKKADAELDGKQFSLGAGRRSGDHADKPYLHSARADRAGQADARARVAPRGSSSCCRSISCCKTAAPAKRSARTISSSTSVRRPASCSPGKIGEFIARAPAAQPAVAFHNGVFGMFEDPRFDEGTRRFVGQLKRLKEAGVEVYVGGGEGGTALEKYGQPDDVTHCFTAGGTVLNALGSEPVPYLVALALAASREQQSR